MSTRPAALARALALGVWCAMAGLAAAGQLPAPARRAAEEAFFLAMKLPVRAQFQAITETKEDPFSPDHWLSHVKPTAEPKPLPVPAPHAALEEIPSLGKGAALLVPLRPGYTRTSHRDRRPAVREEDNLWWLQGPHRVSFTFFASTINEVSLELPPEQVAALRQLDERLGTEHTRRILAELKRLREMHRFDLLRTIAALDARAFGPGVPFPRRVVSLMLFAFKYLFVPQEDTPFGYYRGGPVRALVAGPYDYFTETLDEEGKVAERTAMRRIQADVAIAGCETVLNVTWGGVKEHAGEVTLANFLAFLAGLRLAPAPRPEPD